MKKFLNCGAAIAVAGLLAIIRKRSSLEYLIANNGTLSIGDKVFGDFSFGAVSSIPGLMQTASAAEINVSVGIDAFGNYFLQYQGNISSGVGGHLDLDLRYSVTATGGFMIDGIGQGFNLGAGGNGGTVVIGESATANGFLPIGNPVSHSIISFRLGVLDPTDPTPEFSDLDQLAVPGLNAVFIENEIRLFAADSTSLVSASVIRRTFPPNPRCS